MDRSIADLRKDYTLKILDESNAALNPIDQFTTWWNEAINSKIEEVNAMTLATATKGGVPSARIVLLKGYSEKGFIFYTNYNSKKGKELEENPKACLVFFWKELERQVRIAGIAEKTTIQENNEYFLLRPIGSQIGAYASPQSEVIQNRKLIEDNVKAYTEKFLNEAICCPPYWGGYVLKPTSIEFWQGRSNRLHDRLLYSRIDNRNWKIERLAP